MYKIIVILMIASVLIVGCSQEQQDLTTSNPPLEISPPTLEDYIFLKSTDTFAGTHVGIAGTTPEQVIAFKNILRHKQADKLFSQMQKDGTLAGQLYALCGLYLTDKEKFDLVVESYQNKATKVNTFFGCIMGEEPISTLIPDIMNGSWPETFKNCEIIIL